MTRYGFLWRAHFQHRFSDAGYYKFVRAWTQGGAKRLANVYRHQGWGFTVERWPE